SSLTMWGIVFPKISIEAIPGYPAPLTDCKVTICT
ncbi:hypothetical protein CP061683_1114B, partial [Chlamydia psittaci 06-1683]